MHNKVNFIGAVMKLVYERPDGMCVRQRRSKVVGDFAVLEVLLGGWLICPSARFLTCMLFAHIQHVERKDIPKAAEGRQVSNRRGVPD